VPRRETLREGEGGETMAIVLVRGGGHRRVPVKRNGWQQAGAQVSQCQRLITLIGVIS